MLGFLIAIIAGVTTPQIESIAARPLARALGENFEILESEMRVFAFMIGMFVAAVLSTILGTGSVMGLIIGGILGFFGMRIIHTIQRVIKGNGEAE